jgi:hypothetical protein
MTLRGIPSFHDVFRPLLAGIMNVTTFSYQLRISETLIIVFRPLLFIVPVEGLTLKVHVQGLTIK